ncbi:MAG: N-6 DNA methylase [Burkholderiales bacterium]|nr:N-6 DNA methylase [Burkholderiales bacterium]
MEAVAQFGGDAAIRLRNPSVTGEPEDQLRGPFEQLLTQLSQLCGHKSGDVVAVGETTIASLRTRPDYAVTVRGALVGFIELKAPGKGADPRRFKGHDRTQWQRLQSLPNLIYTDGNAFSLWRNGELAGDIERLDGDIETSGDALAPSPGLLGLFDHFLQWNPQPPGTAKELAEVSARLCRLLRDEVNEALVNREAALTDLATDWRHLLFPEASDSQFADGYAQAVTFGLLMARAYGIPLTEDLHPVSSELRKTSTLIGTALQLLTESEDTRKALKTSLGTLERVLNAVDWKRVSRGKTDAWLYFYEDFLEVYDNDLRKATGSYYTPPEVVAGMVSLVDEALRRPGFSRARGLASADVTVADPAVGTGTFMLGVLRHVGKAVAADEGPGAVPATVQATLARLVGFELQLGPFAVAQLRLLAEVRSQTGALPHEPPRMFVTDTLANPDDDGGQFPGYLAAIGRQRKAANQVKREQPITVVIGNPPYKEKAKGRGGWVEGDGRKKGEYAPLADWQPPTEWGVGAHAKHLRNLYVYFWRWASYKVFDHRPSAGAHAGQGGAGIVAFITVAGFLSGPGFQKMRAYLRERCQEVWVIDASPEGHQPEASTRIFQGVQQPVCIVMASRWSADPQDAPARVRYRSLPAGHRLEKFAALAALRLDDDGWQDCPADARAPFLPASGGAWADFPALEDLFVYDGSGVMPGRTWVIAPDAESLRRRWERLVRAPAEDKERLFHPHLRAGKPGDKHSRKIVSTALAGFEPRAVSVADDTGDSLPPERYAFRSFDRQLVVPDVRLINQPNPQLWALRSERQVFITAPHDRSPSNGPAVTFTGLVPDLHHYNGRGGRVFPLWADAASTQPNVVPALLVHLTNVYGRIVEADEVVAYIAAVAAHPGYIERFRTDLTSPGLRIPMTADAALFAEAVTLGRRVVWLHTYGERMADASKGRPAGSPRLPQGQRPQVPAGGAIPADEAGFPDSLTYDAKAQRLHIGGGFVEPVLPAVWAYEVSGKQVLLQWFNYRRKDRRKPQMGDKRPPSPLSEIQPSIWPAEYTTDLLDLLNVLGLLVELEPKADDLLGRLCAGPLLSDSELRAAGAFAAAGVVVTGRAVDGPNDQLF